MTDYIIIIIMFCVFVALVYNLYNYEVFEKFCNCKNNSNININMTTPNSYNPFNYAYYFPYNNLYFNSWRPFGYYDF